VDFVCLSHDGGLKFHDVTSAKRYSNLTALSIVFGHHTKPKYDVKNVRSNIRGRKVVRGSVGQDLDCSFAGLYKTAL